tara:strand:+ start:388 stop:1569 length:1182 start_codon:yes stop_codon:yes gene_type:complete
MLSFHEPQYLIFILCFVYFIFNYKNLIKIKSHENLIKLFFIITLISYLYGLLNLFSNYGIIFNSTGIGLYIEILSACFLGLIILKLNLSTEDIFVFIKYILLISLLIIILGFLMNAFSLNLFNDDSINLMGSRLGSVNEANANNYGRFLLIPFLLSFVFIISDLGLRDKFSSKKIFYIIFILSTLSIILTFSRTTYFSSICGLFFILLCHSFVKKTKKILSLLFFLFVMIIVILLFDVTNIFSYSDRLTSQDSINPRLFRYEAGIKIISSNPLFGVHPGNYKQSLYDNLNISRFSSYFQFGTAGSAHNMFLHIAIQYGIFSGILYILFPLKLLINSIRKYNTRNNFNYLVLITGIGLCASIIVHGISEVYPPIYLLFFYGILSRNLDLINDKK